MVQVSYPGVYIEEIPSGNRTITGVSTSITAFAGRTRKGPSDLATRITSYAAFEKAFGGLWQHSTVSYAVRQFYQNGGSDAVIVRIVNRRGEAASVTLENGEPNGIELLESSPGTSGSNLRVEVTDDAGTRHIIVTEYTRAEAGAEVILRQADYSGVDAASLSAALDGDTSLIEVSAATASFGSLPDEAGPFEFENAIRPATASRSVLPLSAELLGLEADSNGEAGNNISISIYHSTTDEDLFSLVVEQLQNDGSYNLLGSVEGTTLGNLAADISAVAGIGITASGDPSLLDERPLEIARLHLSGGDTSTAAAINIPTGGLAIEAANEGEWGDRIRLNVDNNTADPGNTALLNLTVELLNDEDRVISVETHRNISVNPDATRFVETILEQSSLLVRAVGSIPAIAPASTGANPVNLRNGADGGEIEAEDLTGPGMQGNKEGLYLLEDTDLFNIMVIPPLSPASDVPTPLWTDALTYCQERRAILIIDPPSSWNRPDQAISGIAGMAGLRDPNSVMYFPRVRAADPLRENMLATFAPSGIMAGLMARTDAERGVWKAPAGLEAGLVGVRSLAYALVDGETGQLNPIGINCLQAKPAAGPVSWGARTLFGDDRLASEWKYLPIRRTALMIEESLYRGTQWAVFEPNDQPLWQQLRLAVDNFMNNLFRRGAFQGATPDEAYFIKCDSETTTQADIDSGIVNIEVGFRPLKPAEFVVIRIRQIAGQVEV